MGYFSLTSHKKTIAIKNKKRILFIVPFKNNEIIIFYEQGTYEHLYLCQQVIIHTGKLSFIASSYIKSQSNKNGEIYLEGSSRLNEGKKYLALLNICDQRYKPYQQIVVQVDSQNISASYYLLQNLNMNIFINAQLGQNDNSQQKLIIEITPNIQNGIMIRCFDFGSLKWSQDILCLGSRYLNSIFITTKKQLSLKQFQFCLISSGEKYQSVNLAKIKLFKSQSIANINGQNIPTHKINLKFNGMKQIKLYRNYVPLGGSISKNNQLYLIGNSSNFQNKQEKQKLWHPVCVKINLITLQQPNLQDKIIFKRFTNLKIGKQIIVRKFLGEIQENLILIVESSSKKCLHRVSYKCPNQKSFDEEIIQIQEDYNRKHCVLSLDRRTLFRYQLVCEQFFQKIKDSPSVIKFNNFNMLSKKFYYATLIQEFIKNQNKQHNILLRQTLIRNVLSLL